jgi:AraC-like DNA-binding protein
MSVIFHEFQPCETLRPYVEFFWSGLFNTDDVDFFAQRVIPNGYIELIIHLCDTHCELLQGDNYSPSPDFTLIGLFTKPYDVHFRRQVNVFGIRFKPEAVYFIFGTPASQIQALFADIECITGRNFREYTSRLRETKLMSEKINLSETYLLNNISKSELNLYYLNRAAEIIRRCNGFISIDELAREVYISARQLEREFKQKLGVSPKRYMRIARLNEVNRMIQKGDRLSLTNLSYACGYADQAHLIRDFKQFTGESPKAFINKMDDFIVNPNIADLSGKPAPF